MEEASVAAWATLCEIYPHEAAESDWPAFVEFFRSKFDDPDYPEEEIRELLNR